MSVLESMKQEASKLKRTVDEILAIDRKELYGAKRLYDVSFEQKGKKQFEMVFGLIEDLSKCYFDRIPSSLTSQINHELLGYKSIFNRAHSLKLEDGDVNGQREQIVSDIESHYESLFKSVSRVINFSNQTGTDFKQIERAARETLDSIKDYSQKQEKNIKDNLNDAASILKSMRTASAEAGVSQQAIHYSQSQKLHEKNADKWFFWVRFLLFSLIVFVIFAGIFLVRIKEDGVSTFGYLETAIFIVVSLWVYAVAFCNKNFHAEKHNEIINANKSKTLATFKSFVDSTKDENVKNQVLLHASASAFSNPTTGFGKGQDVPLPSGVEVARQVIGRAS